MRFVLSVLLLLPTLVFAKGVCDWPVPDYQISTAALSGISKAKFDQALDRAVQVYAPVFAAWGCPLVMHNSWNDGTVNAQAWKEGGQCHVEVFGGMGRFPGMTQRALFQVVMHEIGHHLGGAPYYPGQAMSDEGQSDYFATAYAMPRAGVGSVSSSLVMAQSLARMAGESLPWRPGPRLPNVDRTNHNHPAAQCRLNTYDAGRVHAARPRCWYAGG